tara:strand:+ start:135 stop:698 length:564 start_codon:yes stop_codon:yes gene_type:complete
MEENHERKGSEHLSFRNPSNNILWLSLHRGNLQFLIVMQHLMVVPRRDDDDDVPADKAWAIHAAIIGLNTGNLLFRGLELDPDNPEMVTVACLAVLAAALPFQAIFFLINSYIQEASNVHEIEFIMLQRLSLICQTISYLSLTAIGILMFETHVYVGGSFFAGCIVAFFLLRAAMNQAEALATSYAR